MLIKGDTPKNIQNSVFTSSVINAPIEDVWAITRDFDGLPVWHPAIDKSFIEDDNPADKIGCIRNFILFTGESVRERLLTLCDYNKICRYALLDGPLPMRDYVATFQLSPVTDGGRSLVAWHAEFYTDAEAAVVVAGRIEAIFQEGFAALKQQFT